MVNITSVEDCYVLHPYLGQYIVSPHLQSLVWLIWSFLIGCNVSFGKLLPGKLLLGLSCLSYVILVQETDRQAGG